MASASPTNTPQTLFPEELSTVPAPAAGGSPTSTAAASASCGESTARKDLECAAAPASGAKSSGKPGLSALATACGGAPPSDSGVFDSESSSASTSSSPVSSAGARDKESSPVASPRSPSVPVSAASDSEVAALRALGVEIIKETCVPSLNPKIALGSREVGGGRGLFAKAPIAKGEMIWHEVESYECKPRTEESIAALPDAAKNHFYHFCYCVGNGLLMAYHELDSVPPEEWPSTPPSDDSMYMNHSCDGTAVFVYPSGVMTSECDLMVARRDIAAGEEITFDYGTSEAWDGFRGFDCLCGAPDCRGRITGNDWKLPEVQRKYAGHFLMHVALKIAKFQMSALYDYRIEDTPDSGRRVVTGKAIPEGALVMVLPPNKLVRSCDLDEPNTGLQVAPDLWSCSLTEEDLDNFLNHSCSPNTRGVTRPDLTIELLAVREILPGEPLTIDYDQHEEDLEEFDVSFDCHCGADACRGTIRGHKFLPPDAKPLSWAGVSGPATASQ